MAKIDYDKLVSEIKRIMAEEMALFNESIAVGREPSVSSSVVIMRMEMLLSFIEKLQTKEQGTTYLRAKTVEQREHISLVILGDVTTMRCEEREIYIDDFISYGQMAEIVDYLRKEE